LVGRLPVPELHDLLLLFIIGSSQLVICSLDIIELLPQLIIVPLLLLVHFLQVADAISQQVLRIIFNLFFELLDRVDELLFFTLSFVQLFLGFRKAV
jgi:hypothetical protein